METLLAIILIVFGILQIILFFKIWVMTDNVKDIRNKLVGTMITKSNFEDNSDSTEFSNRKFQDEDYAVIISTG